MVRYLLLSLLIACSFSLQTSHAQSLPGQPNDGAARIALTPTYPVPGDEVTAEFKAHMVDKATARVVWKQDGKVVQEAIGGMEYTFVADKIGTAIDLEVTAYDEDGTVTRQTLQQEVGAVTIVWEADVYTPPFYKGRALHSPDSSVTLLALPSIANGGGGYLDPNELVFNWHLNGSTNPTQSGLGLRSIQTVAKNPFSPLQASVHIARKDGMVIAINHISIPITHPIVHFYESHPLSGLSLHSALGRSYAMQSAESALVAEPYFMNATTRTDPALSYEWRIGTQRLSTPGSIILRPEGQGAGTARVSLEVTHKDAWHQRARAEGTVSFLARSETESTETEPI